ncbi:M48 family metallopeptidase [Geodermatophilus sp. SYSU D01105]
MSTSSPVIRVAGLDVDVVRKDVKNLHLAVYPPFGRVRVAAPPGLDDDAVRLAVVTRLPWIRKQRQRLLQQERETPRQYVDGETHYVWGRKYRLRVVDDGARQGLVERHGHWLELHSAVGTSRDSLERRLTAWYREELKAAIPERLDHWVPLVGVEAPGWAVRRMKTKWGTCQREQSKIWLNLELAKKPPECLDYVMVHELVHLLERNHTERFFDLMSQLMPTWRTHRDVLNRLPLADEAWGSMD